MKDIICSFQLEKSYKVAIMIFEYFGALLAAFLVYLLVQLILLGASNKKKYQFFKERAPGLRVLENPSLFGGHRNSIFNGKYNVFVVDEILKKQGPTVGYYLGTTPSVMTTDLDFIKTFTIDEQYHCNRALADLPVKELENDCIMFSEDEQWMLLRKVIAPAFSSHKIKSINVQEDIESVQSKLIGMIERKLNEAKRDKGELFIEADAEDICERYALDLVYTNFYKQNNVIDFEAEEDRYAKMVKQNLRDSLGFPVKATAAFPALKPVLNWLLLHFHAQGRMRNEIMDFIMQQTKLNLEASNHVSRNRLAPDDAEDSFRLKDGSRFRRNMIDYITDQYREGKLTRDEYFNSTFFLFFAASNTTADSVSRLLYLLAQHQDIQNKLRASILESGRDSEYLTWTLLESMRLFPPAPIGCSRTIKRDIQTKHGLVPAGTFVFTPARTINRLKEYWGEDAEEFRPERWANAKDFHPCQYQTFGGGRRGCPGKELALMEIKMLFDVLMRKYKFDKSQIHPLDNSGKYTSPAFCFLIFDTPTYVRISRVEETTKSAAATATATATSADAAATVADAATMNNSTQM